LASSSVNQPARFAKHESKEGNSFTRRTEGCPKKFITPRHHGHHGQPKPWPPETERVLVRSHREVLHVQFRDAHVRDIHRPRLEHVALAVLALQELLGDLPIRPARKAILDDATGHEGRVTGK